MKMILIAITALTSLAAAALNSSTVLSWKGKYLYDLSNNVELQHLISQTLTEDLDAVSGTQSPAILLDGRFLKLSGCRAHDCATESVDIFIDSKNPKAMLIIRKQERYGAEYNREIKAAILEPNAAWIKKWPEANSLPRGMKAELKQYFPH